MSQKYTLKTLLITLSLLFITNFLNAQNYIGKIGNYPIFLLLEITTDNKVYADYSYQSQLKTIRLQGYYSGPDIIIFDIHSSENDESELFKLKKNSDQSLTGTWNNKGTKLPVKLEKVVTDIDSYKRSHLKLIRDSITVHGNKSLVWFTEKHSNLPLFRLGNGFSAEERKVINPILDTLHFNQSLNDLDCIRGIDINVEIGRISNNHISFTLHTNIDCGAHPSYDPLGYTFRLKDGTQIENLTDLYPNVDFVNLLKLKYENDNSLDHECGYFDSDFNDRWEYSSWMLTKDGVRIRPSFPHAMTVCVESFDLLNGEIK